jgi:hypothetical protein
LPDTLCQLPSKDEWEQVDARRLKVGGEGSAKDPNEEGREDQATNKANRITKQLRDIARGNGSGSRRFTAQAES